METIRWVRRRSKRVTMRSVTSFIGGIISISLTSCQAPSPDFTSSINNFDGTRAISIRGFQPRGTLEGYITISFSKYSTNNEVLNATILNIENGNLGWTSSNTFALIADRLEYRKVSSSYFPLGTLDSRIFFTICIRTEMDCSMLDRLMANNSGARHIVRFPESSF